MDEISGLDNIMVATEVLNTPEVRIASEMAAQAHFTTISTTNR